MSLYERLDVLRVDSVQSTLRRFFSRLVLQFGCNVLLVFFCYTYTFIFIFSLWSLFSARDPVVIDASFPRVPENIQKSDRSDRR